MGGAVVTVMAIWARRCSRGTSRSPDTPTDRRTDDGSGAGSNQTAAYRAVSRIVWVREGRGGDHQPHTDDAGDSRLLSHSLLPERNCQCCTAND